METKSEQKQERMRRISIKMEDAQKADEFTEKEYGLSFTLY